MGEKIADSLASGKPRGDQVLGMVNVTGEPLGVKQLSRRLELLAEEVRQLRTRLDEVARSLSVLCSAIDEKKDEAS